VHRRSTPVHRASARPPLPPRPPPSATESPPPFYGWAARDGPAPVQDLRKLLKACKERDSRQLRDTALIRRRSAPGGTHRAEVIGLTIGSIDPDSDVAVVIGKGRGLCWIPTDTGPGRH
jgi:hypothetical protein